MNNLLCADCGSELEEGECIYCCMHECREHGIIWDDRTEAECDACYQEYKFLNRYDER